MKVNKHTQSIKQGKIIITINNNNNNNRSREISVGMATGYGLDGLGSIPGSARFFFSPQLPDRLWGPPSLLYNEYRGPLSPGVKRRRREADHSPPSNAEAKNGGAIPPLPNTFRILAIVAVIYRVFSQSPRRIPGWDLESTTTASFQIP
jgi:hypothetical protein